MIERLKGLSLPLRSLVYVSCLLLAFFVAFGLGAFVWVAWQGGMPSFLGDRTQRLDGSAETSLPQGKEATQPYTTGPGGSADAGVSEYTASGSVNPNEPAAQVAFLHRATVENSRGDYTYLDVPSINGDPDAVIFATPVSGGTYDHNIGVWYEFVDRKRWAIFNQDRAPVPAGSIFEVVVRRESESFVHRAAPENISANVTYIDDALINGKPDAEVSLTQNWNPGGGIGVYNDHPVGVRYDADREQWAAFNKDLAPIEVGVAFNVSAE